MKRCYCCFISKKNRTIPESLKNTVDKKLVNDPMEKKELITVGKSKDIYLDGLLEKIKKTLSEGDDFRDYQAIKFKLYKKEPELKWDRMFEDYFFVIYQKFEREQELKKILIVN